ncbi:MAG: molybdopterin-dependent oxidoreductase [Chloroflexi bacterium]|nr:molybdopterin-dependent oxidoreductase [Chloroflexota bacterium]
MAQQKKEDVWVHTVCEMCLGACGILAHRVDGVIVKIEGDPNCPSSRGKICSKGNAAIMSLYDPSRLTVPLKRTNSEKGIGVDPKWRRITWDEALDEVAGRLEATKKDDPRKLVISTFDDPSSTGSPFAQAFGTPNYTWAGYFCGQYLHSSMYLTNGTFHCDFDPLYCKYLLLFGNQAGFGAGLNPNITAQNVAEARKRGLRTVVVDPLCNNAGAKADEWVPIRPGTDGAMILAMINVLLNEMGIYDAEFQKRRTNGPYLVKPDGYYLRHDGKPLVWDAADARAKTYDSELRDPALEGSYTVDGVEVVPAFQLLKQHVKKYSPEYASEITTVPANTIRRLAAEFGRAASIGSTMTIDGQEYPLRPVAANIYRGAGAHKHGVWVALAVQTLNIIVGSFYSLGGHRGQNLVGPDWSWAPREHDGLIVPPEKILHHGEGYYGFEVKPPEVMGQDDLYPISTNLSPNCLTSILEGKKFGLPYEPEMLLICRRNLFLGGVKKDVTAEALKKLKFIVFFGTHLDEVSDFADLALPDAMFLEKSRLFPNSLSWSNTAQSGHFMWSIRQPVVQPSGEARDWVDVLEDLSERIGILGKLYQVYNKKYDLKGKYRLDPPRKYSKEEIYDSRVKSELGEDKDANWFRQHGFHNRKRKTDELFPLNRLKSRFPVYYENILEAGRQIRQVTEKMGLDWDIEDYQSLPDWRPCPAYRQKGDFDLFAVNFRVATHSQSFTMQNAWLNEVAKLNPYSMQIWINAGTARKKGISDGDQILVESEAGRMKGTAKLTECVHPETVGISSHFGGWAKGKPLAARKGDNFNCLLPFDQEHQDPISSGVDACVRVRVSRA